jgi:predicted nucleic acid-binding protein
MYRAVLDACTLVPSLQRDFLLQLATEEAFAPIWGTGILAELDYTLARLHERRAISDSEARRRHLLEQMKHAFPGSEIDAPKDRTYDYGLTDRDDGHVARTAIIGKADAIVTDDKRAGFKTAEALVNANVEALFVDEFAANSVAAHPQAGVRALVAMSRRRDNPPETPEQILDQLVERYGMDEIADILRPPLAELH